MVKKSSNKALGNLNASSTIHERFLGSTTTNYVLCCTAAGIGLTRTLGTYRPSQAYRTEADMVKWARAMQHPGVEVRLYAETVTTKRVPINF